MDRVKFAPFLVRAITWVTAPLGFVFVVGAVIALAHIFSLGFPTLVGWPPNVAAAVAAGFGTTAAVSFGIFQHFYSEETNRSERNLEAARRGIQQAWEVLSNDSPTRNMAWVNAARLVLRSQKLALQITRNEHRSEWNLFVEEWKIRFLPFLTASHEYYFGYGSFEEFSPSLELSNLDIAKIAEAVDQVTSLSIGGYSSTLYSDTQVRERAIKVIIDFTSIYDPADDPIQDHDELSEGDLWNISSRHLNGLFVFAKIRREYRFEDGTAIRRNE